MTLNFAPKLQKSDFKIFCFNLAENETFLFLCAWVKSRSIFSFQVKSRNMFADIGAGFKSMVGGEIKGMSKLTRDTRNELIQEASEQALRMGANAITGIRIETNPIFDGTLDMVFYGTAVAVKR